MKKKKESRYDKYNQKRVRLCDYSVTQDDATSVEPALKRLTKVYGSKVKAISAAIVALDKKTKNK